MNETLASRLPDAVVVEKAVHFPACCELCLGQQGPMVDTGVDRPLGPGPGGRTDLRVYICRPCLARSASLIGLVRGAKLDKLMNASEERDRLEKQLSGAEQHGNKLAKALTEEQQAHQATRAQLEQMRDQQHQQLFLVQQLIETGNQLVVGSNGG